MYNMDTKFAHGPMSVTAVIKTRGTALLPPGLITRSNKYGKNMKITYWYCLRFRHQYLKVLWNSGKNHVAREMWIKCYKLMRPYRLLKVKQILLHERKGRQRKVYPSDKFVDTFT